MLLVMVRANSYCGEEEVGHVRQKTPWLYLCFCPYPHGTLDIFASGKSVNHEIECGQEVPEELHFYEPEKAIELPQK